ncbi:MAG: hypothetical protein A3G64_00010 [Candidatus Liptonbacteria bacterium RIFCSPLOWO2_12_FULL_60_15]|uniref:Dockerin domain-containing protein n=1 Tax=Candidatus Liptonbacteria bacterium RIFCSPLOWO2_12_FULL_60_15 TaxID=1798653 RepID=A0A1G2CNC9_9BACT|nr:MAG: hypothetical protein A3G64_00010 [Candidatus Liptonbacteria bacterium RIFCSPLOWO2_12_FULL_60_15]
MDSPQGITVKNATKTLVGVACVALITAWHIMFLPASAQVSVTAKVPGVCGNGIVEIDEQCDPGPPEELGGATCVSRGFAGGTLTCNADCAFDTSQCTPVPPPAPPPSSGGGNQKFVFFPLPLPLPLPTVVVPPPAVSPDLNRDGKVDVQDLSILLFWFGKTGSDALRHDLNGDENVDIADVSVLFYHWTDRSAS